MTTITVIMMNKENVLISACLLGINCKYNGKNNYNPKVEALKEKYNLIPICPETMGGLSTPRIPSEIINDKVINKEGLDVTKQYHKGADIALEVALKNNVELAIFKAKSPSCGSGKIYDGSFSSTVIDGDGVTSKLLKEHGIKVITEDELD